MKSISISADVIVNNLLSVSREIGLCLLDSCGSDHPGSHIMIAAGYPVETFERGESHLAKTLAELDRILTGDKPAIFSLSYDFGRRLHGQTTGNRRDAIEPDLFISVFDVLLVHDYSIGKTFLAGDHDRFDEIVDVISAPPKKLEETCAKGQMIRTSLPKSEYLDAIASIKEQIRRGNTYQTNLTQQLTVEIPKGLSTATIFQRIRRDQPAPFSALLERKDSTVISASPERFFKVESGRICASPIKGTRSRGQNKAADDRLRNELLKSEKDRAENVMIVDLLRNDLGRVCEYGSIRINELCTLQELPTLFHLVSTIDGRLRLDTKPSQIIEALFPCGSITGAPKLRTMKIIDELEPVSRGLSMGAIGVYIPNEFGVPPMLDLSVAIRTMVIRDGYATFNVGGGIVIDSEPEKEWEESLIKARALLSSLGIHEVNKKLA